MNAPTSGKLHPWLRALLGKQGLEVVKAGDDGAALPERLQNSKAAGRLFVRARVESDPQRVVPDKKVAVQDSLDAESYERAIRSRPSELAGSRPCATGSVKYYNTKEVVCSQDTSPRDVFSLYP